MRYHPHDDIIWIVDHSPELVKSKKDAMNMYKPEHAGFEGAKEHVNWAYQKMPNENWSLWTIRHHRNSPQDFTPDIKQKLEHFAGSTHLDEIGKVRFEKTDNLHQGLQKLEIAEKAAINRLSSGKNYVKIPPTAKKIAEFQDGFAWWDLGIQTCNDEGRAMGHCGNAAPLPNDKILSLRKEHKISGKSFYEPFLTFIRNGKLLGEMKGPGNSVPDAKYHQYIEPLLHAGLIPIGGGYAPENNFHFNHLSPEAQQLAISKNPDLLALSGGKVLSLKDLQDLAMKSDSPKQFLNRMVTLPSLDKDAQQYFLNYDQHGLIAKNSNLHPEIENQIIHNLDPYGARKYSVASFVLAEHSKKPDVHQTLYNKATSDVDFPDETMLDRLMYNKNLAPNLQAEIVRRLPTYFIKKYVGQEHLGSEAQKVYLDRYKAAKQKVIAMEAEREQRRAEGKIRDMGKESAIYNDATELEDSLAALGENPAVDNKELQWELLNSENSHTRRGVLGNPRLHPDIQRYLIDENNKEHSKNIFIDKSTDSDMSYHFVSNKGLSPEIVNRFVEMAEPPVNALAARKDLTKQQQEKIVNNANYAIGSGFVRSAENLHPQIAADLFKHPDKRFLQDLAYRGDLPSDIEDRLLMSQDRRILKPIFERMNDSLRYESSSDEKGKALLNKVLSIPSAAVAYSENKENPTHLMMKLSRLNSNYEVAANLLNHITEDKFYYPDSKEKHNMLANLLDHTDDRIVTAAAGLYGGHYDLQSGENLSKDTFYQLTIHPSISVRAAAAANNKLPKDFQRDLFEEGDPSVIQGLVQNSDLDNGIERALLESGAIKDQKGIARRMMFTKQPDIFEKMVNTIVSGGYKHLELPLENIVGLARYKLWEFKDDYEKRNRPIPQELKNVEDVLSKINTTPVPDSVNRALARGFNELMGKSESLDKMALVYSHPTIPSHVWRLQNERGEGPHFGKGKQKFVRPLPPLNPDPESDDYYNPQPDPAEDFDENDWKSWMGDHPQDWYQIGMARLSGKPLAPKNPNYLFGFEHPDHARRWFGDDALKIYADQGFHLTKVPAKEIRRSISGQQVLFLPHDSATSEKSPPSPTFNKVERLYVEDDLEKNWKAALLATSMAASPVFAGAPKAPAAKQEQVKKPQFDLNTLHEELKPIAYLETNMGKYMDHKPHQAGEYHTAHGLVGFKPSTAHDEYLKSKSLQTLYPALHDRNLFMKEFKSNPQLYNIIAAHHWKGLKKRLGSLHKAVYAWRWGQGASRKADDATIKKDPYVQKYFSTDIAVKKAYQEIEEELKKDEDLEKYQTSLEFPKLGATRGGDVKIGQDRMDMILSNRVMRNQGLRAGLYPDEIPEYVPRIGHKDASSQGLQWTTMDLKGRRFQHMSHAVADAQTLEREGVSLGVTINHEQFHSIIGKVSRRFGQEASKRLVNNLWSLIPDESIEHFHRMGTFLAPVGHYEESPDYKEEVLARAHDFLNDSSFRNMFRSYHGENEFRNTDSHIKKVLAHLRVKSKEIDHEWLKDGIDLRPHKMKPW